MKHAAFPRVALIAMPWQRLETPSIQLGLLTALLTGAGATAIPKSYYLQFGEFAFNLSRAKRAYKSVSGAKAHDVFDFFTYEYVAESSFSSGLGDWLFAMEPMRAADESRDAEYLAAIKDVVPKDVLRAVVPLRQQIPSFLDWCVADVLNDEPDVVGFTTTYTQTTPALHLALLLKRARPDVKIVFGGANCDGDMGVEMHKRFAFIDYVVRGEAEHALPKLIAALRGEDGVESVPGLCYRDKTGTPCANPTAMVPMSDVPMPIYDEYFERLSSLAVRKELERGIMLPLETSRGCWWGQKHHCTFCGLNGSTMAFRSKDPEIIKREVIELSSRHHQTHFQTVDNILDLSYFKSLLPWMKDQRAAGLDFTMFYEIKANLRKEQVRLLAESGVRIVQPGIESLSSSILKLMNKGATGIGNIQLLKWGREFGIHVAWNLLYGFPGEDPKEYVKMAELVPVLSHLDPPSLAALVI